MSKEIDRLRENEKKLQGEKAAIRDAGGDTTGLRDKIDEVQRNITAREDEIDDSKKAILDNISKIEELDESSRKAEAGVEEQALRIGIDDDAKIYESASRQLEARYRSMLAKATRLAEITGGLPQIAGEKFKIITNDLCVPAVKPIDFVCDYINGRPFPFVTAYYFCPEIYEAEQAEKSCAVRPPETQMPDS